MKQMKQILVPTDFSECANNAVDFAIQSSKLLPAKITLLHSYEVSSSLLTDYAGVNKEFNVSMLNDAKEKLEKLKKQILEADGIIVDTVVSTISLHEAVLKAVEELKADLVVMGTVGASGLKEKLWGSRTSAVIGKSVIPVMVVPLDYKWKKPEKILFATNQFEKDPVILNYLFELAGQFMASTHVTVFTDEDDDKAAIFLEHQGKIAEYETFLKESYKEDSLTSSHIFGENFEDTLQDFIKENEIDMLVMVTYQQGFWKRIFNPSKTEKMSYQTKLPLLAIPASMASEK